MLQNLHIFEIRTSPPFEYGSPTPMPSGLSDLLPVITNKIYELTQKD